MKLWWQSIHREEIHGDKASAKANTTKHPRAEGHHRHGGTQAITAAKHLLGPICTTASTTNKLKGNRAKSFGNHS